MQGKGWQKEGYYVKRERMCERRGEREGERQAKRERRRETRKERVNGVQSVCSAHLCVAALMTEGAVYGRG